jgi:hypothetical protein
MTESQAKTEKKSVERIADAFEEHLEKPKLRNNLVNNLSAALDTDEKIKKFAKELDVEAEELKHILKK